ncbi:nucleolar protein nop25 [Phlyctema vagabunda]|uniref:Nucleolar protein nop25 n=1 Tax=Phlyctema vagabunda TaxID=108571 RepID=A0ABR4P4H7_9HELO
MDTSMFVRPRPKKSLLPPPSKKRRTNNSAIEEISFDFDARAEYLTGFHKRKVQRAKAAQEQAAKLAREERITTRKQLREERKQELEEHVEAVNALLKDINTPGESIGSDGEEWGGIEDDVVVEPVIDHEEEYIDEDRYTTVTVEAVDVSKDGLHKIIDEDSDETAKVERPREEVKEEKGKKVWPKKPRKQKFRYESKAERRFTRGKQKAGNKAKADARRGND